MSDADLEVEALLLLATDCEVAFDLAVGRVDQVDDMLWNP